jgi:hypothetical protein
MDVTKPYKFVGFGTMGVTKPYKLLGSFERGVPQAVAHVRKRQVSTTTAGPQSRGMIFRGSCRPGGRYEFPVPSRSRISTRAGRYAAS